MNIQGMAKLAGQLDGVKPSTQAVLWQLAAHSQGDTFNCTVGQATIAANTGLSVRSVVRGIRELREAGIIAPKGYSTEYKVRRWAIQLQDTHVLSIVDAHATGGNPHATGDHSQDTHGLLSKRTKRTRAGTTSPALEGAGMSSEQVKALRQVITRAAQ